jgi:excisionase family DNA binding protein
VIKFAAMNREDYITTNEAGDVLGVTRQRVLQLIQDGRLKAEKFANVYMIRRGDLSNIEEKPMGRPPKPKANGAVKKKGKK